MTAQTFEDRARIEQLIQGRTLCDDLRQTAEERGDQPAFSDRAGGEWKTLTWSQARRRALELAAGFAAVGCRPGDRVALMLPNRVEHVLADLGALHAGAVPVTLYATFAPEQVAYVAADCAARVAVLDPLEGITDVSSIPTSQSASSTGRSPSRRYADFWMGSS